MENTLGIVRQEIDAEADIDLAQLSLNLAATPRADLRAVYRVERSFSAAKFEETVWDRLLPNDAEGYRLHLAFEIGHVTGFRIGYIAIRRGGIVVCIAPYFITDTPSGAAIPESLQHLLSGLRQAEPGQENARLLVVGSPVTDNCKLGIAADYPFDPDMMTALCDELECIAERDHCSTIVFKGMLDKAHAGIAATLQQHGFVRSGARSTASMTVRFSSLDDYLASLGDTTRKDVQLKLRMQQHVRIAEFNGMPPDFDALYRLYLQPHARSKLQFERLTAEFFESLVGLMPQHCRFVLYYAPNAQGDETLIGFNLLLHRDGMLLNKYMGQEPGLSEHYHLDLLSWLHNIDMCIRDGFHTYQSGPTASAIPATLGARLEPAHVFLRQRAQAAKPVATELAGSADHAELDLLIGAAGVIHASTGQATEPEQAREA